MGSWWPRRVPVAGAAVVVAAATGTIAGLPPESGAPLTLAWGSGTIAILALFAPAAITGWVVWGLVMAASSSAGQGGDLWSFGIPVIMGVVVTTELLAAVARMDLPMEPATAGQLRRAVVAASLTGAVSGTVGVLGGVVWLSGLVALAIGAGACALIALVLLPHRE